MEEPLCSACSNPAELVTLPDDNPDAFVNYLCSICFGNAAFPGSFAVPYTCVQSNKGKTERNLSELESRSSGLVRRLYLYQERVKNEAEMVRRRYEKAFNSVIQGLAEAQERVLADINESEATEVEHINAVIGDLKEILDKGSLNYEVAYLASYFNKENESDFPGFMAVSKDLEEYEAGALNVPVPVITKGNIKGAGGVVQQGNVLRQGTFRRLTEDTMLIMPIDTRNILITDFSASVPQHKLVPCRPRFNFRLHSRWCRVNDHAYAYTGGLYHGSPVNWCDLIDLSQVNTDQQITSTEGSPMVLARYRHALICYGNALYAFGGHLDELPELRSGRGIECLSLVNGEWIGAEWTQKGDMEEEVSDLTATALRNCIYLAGNSRAIYKFDIATNVLEKVLISRILDIRITPNPSPFDGPIETGRITDPRYPLPRQSSNTLIFAWEAQIMLLQHEFLYYFTPGSLQVDMSRKKVGLVKPWCSPFPAVVKGSRCFFMLEPTESDLMPAGEVWSFDFIKKTVSLVDFKAKSR